MYQVSYVLYAHGIVLYTYPHMGMKGSLGVHLNTMDSVRVNLV